VAIAVTTAAMSTTQTTAGLNPTLALRLTGGT
jgi:hypothetical protein